jgi:high-affinity iron transporter
MDGILNKLMNIRRRHITLLITVMLLAFSLPIFADTKNPTEENEVSAQKIVHILDYVSLEYAGVVKNGVITNQSEYNEQKEFAGQMVNLVDELPLVAGIATLKDNAKQILAAIQQIAPGDKVASLCTSMSLRVIDMYKMGVAPRTAPSLTNAANLFQENCSRCHGMDGYGDGPMAASLEPHPANFHDRDRQQHRSVFSLYNTISLGVHGTAMPSFSHLNSQQRWQLAFYVSNFFASDNERAKGAAFLKKSNYQPKIKNLQQLTQTTPAQMAAQSGEDGVAELAYLRSNPTEVQKHMSAPLQVAEDNLHASLTAYQQGKNQAAYDLAVAAYLEGFELVERNLEPSAPELRKQIEKAMLNYRNMIKNKVPVAELQDETTKIVAMLGDAHGKLHTSHLSSSVNFLSALVILLREGLEAILVLAAISAVLIKTGRREAMRYLHMGWISALALGVVTWFIAGHFISISGASRELTEGVTALVAATMLIYVGFWLHKQSNAIQWQKFIHAKLSASLSDGAMTGMAAIAFIAVYREVFETILFYNTLWLETDASGHVQVMSGMLTSVVLLMVIAWAIFKFSIRLPLKLFFGVNSVFLYLLAIVFAGKGIAALQEAGKLPINPVNFFEVSALGIFPNMETLGIQALMIGFAMLLYIVSRNKLNRKESQA